ncbi:predicted protein [Phaeodactylum tricornutum CCAP 1055/1]|uniref:Uncharacterized protein n=1 Tax=Phaeodactylum tricornutum (strain CCAP 1055/1) TaxID=556484 RepID=B7GB82_PHATC|nr:predicted protein [Phaeodactylum tricornutum CCAP 1055/1]EEC44071.1 predicted protein [Phaeodactylum tricornutum CCAP 1055/1]|eukprot:XP_002184322.1 predicted protein [Phaeodactylum tricornutum CCAP 1055/1]
MSTYFVAFAFIIWTLALWRHVSRRAAFISDPDRRLPSPLWHVPVASSHGDHNDPMTTPTNVSRTVESLLSLRVGDLPGYTGWARPVGTLSPYFRQVSDAHGRPTRTIVTVGRVWTVRVACTGHVRCFRPQRAILDVRAYGPSVVAGMVVPSRVRRAYDPSNTTASHDTIPGYYDVQIVFPDAGVYHVEVVLAFSNAPAWNEFPLAGPEPDYEGYLLPDFPLTVVVDPVELVSEDPTTHASQDNRPVCTNADLLETSPTSAIIKGRWRVSDKVQDRRLVEDAYEIDHSPSNISRTGYEQGVNSLGITMAFEYQKCKLATVHQSKRILMVPKTKDWYILFVGDSNMRAQHLTFQSWHGRDRNQYPQSGYISTAKGLAKQLPQIREKLSALKKHATNRTEFYVLFNAGLHDIARLCSRKWSHERFNNGDTRPCVEQYRQHLGELINGIKDLSPKLAVLQTTIAGWPKWGNFGFAWPPSQGQPLPFHSSTCQSFNEIAWEEATKADISVMDAYWLTVPRPDHRQVDNENAIGKHMVHVGPEIHSVMQRKWISLIEIALGNDNPVM